MSNDIIEFVHNWGPEVACVLALNVLGLLIKSIGALRVPDDIPNAKILNAVLCRLPNLIPVILPVVGTVLALQKGIDPVVGFVLGGMAVWGHQVIKQGLYANNDGNGEKDIPGNR